METLSQRVEKIIHGEATAGSCRSSLEFMLSALSPVYGAVMRLRARLYRSGLLKSRRLPCFVISVGNITVGGTGKTPMTIYVVEKLKEMGLAPAVVSRGYRGGMEKEGGVVSDGENILAGPSMAGDEPWLLAKTLKVPVVVGSDRYKAGMTAVERFAPDVIVLDDAFQHLKLERDLDIVLLDGRRPFGNGSLLPAGPLREPAEALGRGDLFVLTRTDRASGEALSAARECLGGISGDTPVFRTVHAPYLARFIDCPGEKGGEGKAEGDGAGQTAGDDAGQTVGDGAGQTAGDGASKPGDEGAGKSSSGFGGLSGLNGKRGFAFSGIADNSGFFSTVAESGCTICGTRAFTDHHRYSGKEIGELFSAACKAGADCLLTTEKDFVRFAHLLDRSLPHMPLAVIGIRISFGEDFGPFENALDSALTEALKGRR